MAAGLVISARMLGRDVGSYLGCARRRVVAVTYHGVIEGYLISPDVYAGLLEAKVPPVDGHLAAVARMDAIWAKRTSNLEPGCCSDGGAYAR